MELDLLDYILVPCGLLMLGIYHFWLLYTIKTNPRRTVIGMNAENRQQWVCCIMADPFKNGTLAVQAIRNNQMATTQLATISITLSSVITTLVSALSSSSSSSQLQFVGIVSTASYIKFLAVLLCFLLAFFCNLQAMRYYAHVSLLITTASSQGRPERIDYVVQNLNMGGLSWSFGMRAFYFSFPLLLWIFGSVPMFLCCCVMTFVLYFLDTTDHFNEHGKEENGCGDRNDQPAEFGSSVTSGTSSPTFPLLGATN